MSDSALIGYLQQAGVVLNSEQHRQLLWFLDELLRWNRRVNLTAITDREEALEKHLVDSLTLCPLLDGARRLLDLGSGGGFPAIPLKIALPSLAVVSVDAVQKKVAFQRHAVRQLALSGFEALHLRAERLEEMEGYAGSFDTVVSRAFTSLPGFAAFALPCLAPGGRIVAMKGAEGEQELEAALPELQQLGLACSEVRTLRLPASQAQRSLIVLRRSDAL